MHPVHLLKVGIGPFGADGWPCATGLVSYPFKLLFFSHADDFLFEALHGSDLIASPWSSPIQAPSIRIAHSAAV
jgi:hypothetical protein